MSLLLLHYSYLHTLHYITVYFDVSVTHIPGRMSCTLRPYKYRTCMPYVLEG